MAASTRALTPTHSTPFAPPETKPSAHPSLHPNSTLTAAAALRAASKSPRTSPQPLSGAAAMADARSQREQRAREESQRSSPNPAAIALNALISSNTMSRPKQGPAPAAQMSEPLQKVAKSIVIPDNVTSSNLQTSPVSLSSFGSNESTTAATATASETATAPFPPSPFPPFTSEPMNEEKPAVANGASSDQASAQSAVNSENAVNRSMTFPGPLTPGQDPRQPSRQMSLPMPATPSSGVKSPSNKRHKCPYCATDFTRHHNLKSHLLTHSQEKPYECPDCHARFRRLHDLKRHTKLHTGERPHTCPRCGRKFARGDALARHNKGPGGCPGRRDYELPEDDTVDAKGEDDPMVGLEYQDDEGNPRRISEPSRQGSQQEANSARFGPLTFPPVAAPSRAPNSAPRPLLPPAMGSSRDQSMNVSPKTSSFSSNHYSAQPGVYAHGGMTESPKPISPGQPDHKRIGSGEGTSLTGARSPNVTQAMNPQQFSRPAGRGTSPIALPPPGSSNAPQLPQLPGLGTTDPRLIANQTQGSKGILGLPHSNAGSSSSHGGSGGSLRDHLGGREAEVWQVLRDMEARNSQRQQEYENRIAQLECEVRTLRSQLPPNSRQ